MESQHDVDPGTNVVTFKSNAAYPYYMFSNFFETDVYFEDEIFPSSEHAFQASLFPSDQRSILTKKGLLGSWSVEAFMYFYKNRSKAEDKMKWWSKKKQIGVLAKMYAKRTPNKKDIDFEKCEFLFKQVLFSKYTQSKDIFKLLLSTKNSYLLELDISANRRWVKEKIQTRWGGMIINGRVVGKNQMGALHMWLRDELLKL